MSIQVVPQAVLRDQAAIHLRDALKNVSGVQPDFSFGNLDARFTLRGFPTTESYVSTGVYIDGFLMPFIPASPANIEQVEVLKGSTGALYGRIEPGGIINLKTKRPTRQPYYSVTQYLGSFDTYQNSGGCRGPITQDESVLYRFNFEYLDADSFRDVVSTQRTLVAPSLTWNISDSTKLDVDFTYLETDNVDDFGIPARGNALVPIPRETFLGSLDDESNTKFYYESVMLTHEFGPSDLGDWSTRVKFVKFNADEFFQETGFDGFLDPANPNILSRNLFRSDGDGFVKDSIFVAAELIGKFHTGFLNHTLLLGGEYYDREAHDNFFFASGAPFAPDIDITNPTLIPSGGIFTPDIRTITDIHEERFSFTLQDQVEIGKQLYLMGARFDFADFEVSFDPNGIVVGRVEEEEVSPRFGLLYKPLPWLGVFGSFAQGFNGNFPDAFEPIEETEPQQSEQFEVGLKLQTPDERFDATLAFYDLTEENIVVSDPDPALAAQGRTLQIGEGNSRGIELDVHGQITPEWDVIATYALTDTEITQDTSGLQGNRFPNSPLHSGSIFTKYKFSQVGLSGLSLAFGAYLVDDRQGNRANSFQLPGYARFDLALAHRFEAGKGSITLQLNVENLTDEEYFLNGGGFGGNVVAFANPGASRTFLGSVRVEF